MTIDNNVDIPLADRIQTIRDRLKEIEKERAALAPDDFAAKTDLMDEEHTLEAKLGELRAEAAEGGVGIAERSAGEASSHEGVPDIRPPS